MTVIDEYLKNIEPAKKAELERIRKIAKEIILDATETISYGMPTLQYKGTSFLGFSARAQHIGIYPYGAEEIEVFKDALSEYGLSKGAIRVPLTHPIPKALLKEIILYRVRRISQKHKE